MDRRWGNGLGNIFGRCVLPESEQLSSKPSSRSKQAFTGPLHSSRTQKIQHNLTGVEVRMAHFKTVASINHIATKLNKLYITRAGRDVHMGEANHQLAI